jgi:general secretion pathway protein M
MSLLRSRSIASRALALALLIGGVAMFWLFAVAPIKTWYDVNDQAINNGIRALSILKSVAAEGRQARPDLSPDGLERYRGNFLGGAEDPIIVAELQTRLSSLIAARAGELNSAQALQPKAKDGLDYLGLRLQFRAEMKSVQEILHAIETSAPLLFIERAALRLDERGGADRGKGADSVAPMSVEIDIYGAKWPDTGAPTVGAKAR